MNNTAKRERVTGSNRRPAGWIFSLLAPATGLLLAAGCQNQPAASPPAPVPAVVPAVSVPADLPGQQSIEIVSDPAGARIVVNNQPMGRAPLRLPLHVTPQGFCAEYVTISARFVAGDATQLSQSVETQLSPLEKAPASILFSRQGAQRRMR